LAKESKVSVYMPFLNQEMLMGKLWFFEGFNSRFAPLMRRGCLAPDETDRDCREKAQGDGFRWADSINRQEASGLGDNQLSGVDFCGGSGKGRGAVRGEPLGFVP
jgi:hypothetical protein